MNIDPQKLKQIRHSKGWTQQHMADASELSLRTIQRLEKTGNIAAESLQALCAVLEVSPTDLLVKMPDKPSSKDMQMHPTTFKLSILGAALGGTAIGFLVSYWI